MMTLKRATELKDLALEVGMQEAADAWGIKVGSVKRAIQLVNKAKLDSYGRAKEVYGRSEMLVHPPAMKAQNKVMEDHVKYFKGFGGVKQTTSRVLAIGDIHAPFDLDSYFDFCCGVYEQYKCDKVVFIGDVVDNHYSSYHEADPDGMCAGRELDLAIDRLGRWYRKFPDAEIIIGNHDRIVARKAQTAGVGGRWIRGYTETLETPDWNFSERVVIDGVQYIHGEGGTARTKSRKDMMSTVQGHLHTQAYTEWTVGAKYKIFGCQVGCGINHESYAMSYAKNFGKPAIGCAVVLNGKTCINELASL
jgi:metallophosphoesterase superfamily enzyme